MPHNRVVHFIGKIMLRSVNEFQMLKWMSNVVIFRLSDFEFGFFFFCCWSFRVCHSEALNSVDSFLNDFWGFGVPCTSLRGVYFRWICFSAFPPSPDSFSLIYRHVITLSRMHSFLSIRQFSLSCRRWIFRKSRNFYVQWIFMLWIKLIN